MCELLKTTQTNYAKAYWFKVKGLCLSQTLKSGNLTQYFLLKLHNLDQVTLTYQFAGDMNHYIYQKLSALDFHPSQYLGEVCEKNQQLDNNIPYQPTVMLLSCFLPSSFPMNQ